MNKQNNNFNSECVVGMILSFVPAILLNSGNVNRTFWFTAIVLLINAFLFVKIRYETDKLHKNFAFSSMALSMSIWFFLHCLFVKYTACQEFIIWLTRNNKEMAIFNSDAFSFFMAAFVLLIIAVVEAYRIKNDITRIINYIFISVCSIIIIYYVVIFPDIILSEPKIKLSISGNKLKAERSYGELFYNGQLIKGFNDDRFEWYLDGRKIGNGELTNKWTEEKVLIGYTKGIFQVIISHSKCEKCEIIKSNFIEL